jgi:hypothetical protein
MEERNLESWEEFERDLKELRKSDEDPSESRSELLFRGQRDSCWRLETTLDREQDRVRFIDYYRLIHRIHPQIETMVGVEYPIPTYPEVEPQVREYDEFSRTLGFGRCPGYAYMAYLRHHGFPSPFLDWTRSHAIAAFFAFRHAEADSKGRVAIYILSERAFKMHGNRMPVVFRYGPYVKTHRRHVLQQSEYTLCLRFDTEWRFERYDTVFDSGHLQQGICRKFTIPASERRKVLEQLDEFNVNAFSLFGSEESLMETLTVRELFLRDGLGPR